MYWSVFRLFFYLGCISFGGPTAHFALFQKELIEKRQWMDSTQYMQLMALCQILPGPSSSQMGIILGFQKGGYIGSVLAWLGFTLPSAMLLGVIAMGINSHLLILQSDFVHGLKIAVFAVVAHAILVMIKQICHRAGHYFILLLITALSIAQMLPALQLLLLAAVIGVLIFHKQSYNLDIQPFTIKKKTGFYCLFLFFAILFLMPNGLAVFGLMAQYNLAELFYLFYHAGALVFGGGHVVLPLLEQSLVFGEWVESQSFLTGYAIVQTMPGPLFNFSSYLGVVAYPMQPIVGAGVAVLGIFLPAFLIIFGVLPFAHYLNQSKWLKSAFMGVSAAVIGLLLSTLYQPIFVTTILDATDFIIAMLIFFLLWWGRLPIWLLVSSSGVLSMLL